jgi:uncharacterized protein (TIGR02145 family)
MRNMLFIFFTGMTLIACQKNDDNNNNNTTTGATHSCGATNVHNPNLTYGTVKDIDGNTYKTIQIGTQTWMAENLKTTKYRNGTPIPNITDNTQWKNNTTGAYCSYNNNTTNDCPFGKLYNWYAVNNNNGLCPTGWHVPTDEEWTTLTTSLGGESVAGGKMKSTSTQYWLSPNTEATNSSGWSGLPFGNRETNGTFASIGDGGNWWSSSETNTPGCTSCTSSARDRYLLYDDGVVYRGSTNKTHGAPLRCIKD